MEKFKCNDVVRSTDKYRVTLTGRSDGVVEIELAHSGRPDRYLIHESALELVSDSSAPVVHEGMYIIRNSDFEPMKQERFSYETSTWISSPHIPLLLDGPIIVRDLPRYYADENNVIDRHGGEHGMQYLTIATFSDINPEEQAQKYAEWLNET